MRFFLIDDHAIFRAALRALLEMKLGAEVVGDSGSAREAVRSIGELKPDVVLLDIALPGLSGLDAIALIRRAHPPARIVMLTQQQGGQFLDRAFKAGANAYLSKDSDPRELTLAIESAARGYPFISPRIAADVVAARDNGSLASAKSRIERLTPREREVFQLLAVGCTNKEVARDLAMSLGTVKKHRENLQRKLDCHSSAELARLAIREGLLPS